MIFTVNGGWNGWGSWTSCTATCEGGTKSRSRSCTNPKPSNGGKPCPGSSRDRPACNTNGCSGMLCFFFNPDILSIIKFVDEHFDNVKDVYSCI